MSQKKYRMATDKINSYASFVMDRDYLFLQFNPYKGYNDEFVDKNKSKINKRARSMQMFTMGKKHRNGN